MPDTETHLSPGPLSLEGRRELIDKKFHRWGRSTASAGCNGLGCPAGHLILQTGKQLEGGSGSPRTAILPLSGAVASPQGAALSLHQPGSPDLCTNSPKLNISVLCSVWGTGTVPPRFSLRMQGLGITFLEVHPVVCHILSTRGDPKGASESSTLMMARARGSGSTAKLKGHGVLRKTASWGGGPRARRADVMSLDVRAGRAPGTIWFSWSPLRVGWAFSGWVENSRGRGEEVGRPGIWWAAWLRDTDDLSPLLSLPP